VQLTVDVQERAGVQNMNDGGTFWFRHAVLANKNQIIANWRDQSLIFVFAFSVEAEIGRRECPTEVSPAQAPTLFEPFLRNYVVAS
jgi:hypothetical protein